MLVVSKICAVGSVLERVREQSAKGEERRVGGAVPRAAVGAAEVTGYGNLLYAFASNEEGRREAPLPFTLARLSSPTVICWGASSTTRSQ